MVTPCSQRKTALRRNLLLLRSLTNSKSRCKTSIVMDAHDYIQELKSKVNVLKKEHINSKLLQIAVPNEVTVVRVEKGYIAKVTCEKSKDLLVSVVEAIEKLGLNVLQARVSCKNSFLMEALVQGDSVEGHVLKHALVQTIKNVINHG